MWILYIDSVFGCNVYASLVTQSAGPIRMNRSRAGCGDSETYRWNQWSRPRRSHSMLEHAALPICVLWYMRHDGRNIAQYMANPPTPVETKFVQPFTILFMDMMRFANSNSSHTTHGDLHSNPHSLCLLVLFHLAITRQPYWSCARAAFHPMVGFFFFLFLLPKLVPLLLYLL